METVKREKCMWGKKKGHENILWLDQYGIHKETKQAQRKPKSFTSVWTTDYVYLSLEDIPHL
jgi:hypothetical protein